MAEERDVCPGCGQPLDECRDPETAGRWRVEEDTCQACRVAQAVAQNLADDKRRGVHLYTELARG